MSGPINDLDYRKIGQRIRARRKELGLSQDELCVRSGIGSSYISGIENGHAKPSLPVLVRLANGLETSLDYCLYDQYDHPAGILENTILQDLRKLNDTQKQMVLKMVHLLADSEGADL